MKYILFKYLILNLICDAFNDIEFDKYSRNHGHIKKIDLKFDGYKSIRNTGHNNGCCGANNKGECLPCRHELQLQTSYLNFEKVITLQEFPKATSEIRVTMKNKIYYHISNVIYLNIKILKIFNLN
ncbi:hypothetical protein HZS_637 [Henneguya salminicola]|nr:hypothetical protein HZS_637 [Henneguya salminicola]